jgi:S-adenosylmethionine-diacylglycerol 3-amino-3-carboxypropyl transferase
VRTPDKSAEVAARADFSIIRYAQCWEDADTLLEALDIQPGDACFSVGSGGENSLSMLARAPSEVVAVDLSPAQVACIEIKAAGFKALSHGELLELVGIRDSTRREALYAKVRGLLPPEARRYWDGNAAVLGQGLVSAGKFESYFRLYRQWVLRLVHGRRELDGLFTPRAPDERRRYYREVWNNWRWQALMRLFSSRFMLARHARDPSFFRYVEGGVSAPIFERIERALTELDPSRNAYVQWVAYGRFGDVLPHAWRAGNFEAIRANAHRLRTEVASVESYLARAPDRSIDRFNLSDIFEYVSAAASEEVFDAIARCGRPGGRAAYWNMQVPRRRPERLAHRLNALEALGARLHRETATMFYSAFHVDEIAADRP